MQNGKERKINIAELVNCDIIINRRYKMNEIVDDLDGTLARVDYILEAAKQLRDKALAEVAEIESTMGKLPASEEEENVNVRKSKSMPSR